MDRRQIALTAVIVLFMAVTVGHVAAYTGSFEPPGWAWLGIVYAVGVDLGIGVCAWLTRWKTTRGWAVFGYAILTFMDGTFNVGHVRPWEHDAPLSAWMYSLLPTAIQAILGMLARQLSKMLGNSAKVNAFGALASAIGRRFGVELPQEAEASAQPARNERNRRATIDDWRAIYAQLNGDRRSLDADGVKALVLGADLAPPSRRTMQAWAREARESNDDE